jgi:hypothetical protein
LGEALKNIANTKEFHTFHVSQPMPYTPKDDPMQIDKTQLKSLK